MNTFRTFSIALILLFILSNNNQSFAQSGRLKSVITKKRVGIWKNQKIEYVSGQILLKLKPEVQRGNALSMLSQNKLELIEDFDKLGWALVELPKGIDELSLDMFS